MKKTVLVTGGAGFMGSHLVDYLITEGHEVYSVDDLSGGFAENVNANARFVKLDLRDKEGTAKFIKEAKPEIIYHLAADATEGRSQFMPVECNSRNLTAYLNVLVPAIRRGMEKIVVCSSMAVYGNQKPPFSEDLEPKPEDIYGLSKFAMEKSTEILAKVHGFKYTILRPHNVYGPRQNMTDPYRNVIAIFINCLLRNKSFYIYGDGEQRRSFSYVDDITPCVAKTGFEKKADGEIINIGPAEEQSVNYLAQSLLKIFKMENLKPTYLSARPQEVKHAWCTHHKAERFLGFKKSVSFEDGLMKMVDWAKKIGPKEPRYVSELELISDNTPKTWSEKLI